MDIITIGSLVISALLSAVTFQYHERNKDNKRREALYERMLKSKDQDSEKAIKAKNEEVDRLVKSLDKTKEELKQAYARDREMVVELKKTIDATNTIGQSTFSILKELNDGSKR